MFPSFSPLTDVSTREHISDNFSEGVKSIERKLATIVTSQLNVSPSDLLRNGQLTGGITSLGGSMLIYSC